MNVSETLAPHLPYLRRYGRALTGDQARGDAIVRKTLAAIVAGERALPDGVHPRLGLYRIFQSVWADEFRHDGPSAGTTARPDGLLKALSPLNRAALLLTSVEAFSLEEASYILSQSPQAVEKTILEAQESIDKLLASRVLIIEDEPIIALDLENLLTELGHRVVATAATRDEAVAKAHTERPGLVLADINLGEGGSGIDAVSEILESFNIPVIFVTAYPERLLTGERPEPTYLIAKPFLPETIQATVSQALFFHPETTAA
ncbi:MAG TPA: response regulator [Rhizomicrobium sp.]|jgi:CheY-like chemotaxis protein|nr:response regulator [Rhizomicrobium sp.]